MQCRFKHNRPQSYEHMCHTLILQMRRQLPEEKQLAQGQAIPQGPDEYPLTLPNWRGEAGLGSPTGLERHSQPQTLPPAQLSPPFPSISQSRIPSLPSVVTTPSTCLQILPPPAHVWTTCTFHPSPPPSLQPCLQTLTNSSEKKARFLSWHTQP